MYYRNRKKQFDYRELLATEPKAIAQVYGNSGFPEINGAVRFYQTEYGVLVVAEILGLPVVKERCGKDIFAFHIHGGDSCSGNLSDEFADAGTHYNPDGCLHPYHVGDMPPLLATDRLAFLAFITDRFTVDEIVGKTVIIHESPDDFMTQPSGNAGMKIACGEINYY